jgi:hypothetical protein
LEQQEPNHGPLKLTVAISLYDLGQRKPSSEELVEMVKRFNYEAGAAFLARLNVCLSLAIASSDSKVVVETYKKLTSNVLSPAFVAYSQSSSCTSEFLDSGGSLERWRPNSPPDSCGSKFVRLLNLLKSIPSNC